MSPLTGLDCSSWHFAINVSLLSERYKLLQIQHRPFLFESQQHVVFIDVISISFIDS